MSGAKTILIAHRDATVRERFAAALADARHDYIMADSPEAALAAVRSGAAVHLALADAGLGDGLSWIGAFRDSGGRAVPVVVFAGTVATADDVRRLAALGVSGYVNEHASTPQILPALAPYLFPDSFDRRSSPRVTLEIPVSYRAGPTIAGALTRDLSKGGVAIRTMTPLGEDTPVDVRFRLPGGRGDIDAGGRVVWSRSQVGMGVRFDRLDAASQREIDEFINRKS